MLKIILFTFSVSLVHISCEAESSPSVSYSSSIEEDTDEDTICYYNGRRLYRGPQGGCYYINSNGNKTYVDRSECNC